jgi:hypothetical protein
VRQRHETDPHRALRAGLLIQRRRERVSDHLRLPTFIKQYGIERTGTNVLRALLEGYVGDVVVLMHVLGDKHSPPVDLRAVLGAVEGRPDAGTAFVTAATQAAPASTTDVPEDARQVGYLRTLACDLYRLPSRMTSAWR